MLYGDQREPARTRKPGLKVVGTTDALWHFLFDSTPREILKAREMQLIALARYGRQSLHQWGDVEVMEVRRWVARLNELLEEEAPRSNSLFGAEDR